jgi:1-acyl-sn-glycerol-3-phosphate acyltransferase
MEQIFLSLYHFFEKRRSAFWIVFAFVIVVISIGALQIKIEEDVSKFFPDDERVEKLNYVFRNAKLAERLVFMVSISDSTKASNADSLVLFTEKLIPALEENLKPFISSISSTVDDSRVTTLLTQMQDNLPFFLDENDYLAIDSMIGVDQLRNSLEKNYHQLISPTGIVTKKLIANDPLGISFLVLKKLQSLQVDDNVELYDNYLVTKDHRHLIFFIQPLYKPADTGRNAPLIDRLNETIEQHSTSSKYVSASYFGATAVAVANAKQLQRDTYVTLSIMLVLLAIILFGYFKRKRVILLIFIPVVFGALFSLSCIYLVQGTISILALAAGSIILGIAINYSLHFLSHLKHAPNRAAVIKDLVKPMTIGSTTTVVAFFCLQFANAAVLRDVGLFAGFSLIGAALCSLIFLPHLIQDNIYANETTSSWIEKLSSFSLDENKILLSIIAILTPVFFFFANDVKFNNDLSQLNFMTERLKTSQSRLESINKASLTSVYVVSQSNTLENALRKNEHMVATLEQLQSRHLVQRYSGVSKFLISDSLQQVRLNKWKSFWTSEKITNVLSRMRSQGRDFHFSQSVFLNFETLLRQEYHGIDPKLTSAFRSMFFDDFIIEKDGLSTVITLANVAQENKGSIYQKLNAGEANAFDRQMITNLFVEYVHADFNFIVTFTSLLVFVVLLLTYGRIELTVITFFPMLVTWIWILGIMALVGIEFNIINVMISTFIFGLGDDFSIFTMDGLQQEYSQGRNSISSIRTSIFLSALTTISGLGVLIFAEHPALRSIAAISIIGIVCVFVMSQTIEPFMFRWLITRRAKKKLPPMTLWGIASTIFLYSFFAVGSVLLTIVGLLLRLVPFSRKRVKLLYHSLICRYTGALVFLAPGIRKRIEGGGSHLFERPSIIVANHSSFLDILFTVGLNPRVILLTNKWVYNSPVFGGVVRLADYYPVMEGAEPAIEKLRSIVDDGYSIVVFPEGTRSTDGTIKRFHKGAFFLAHALNIPIQPLVIAGAGDSIPKGHFYVMPGTTILKFLPKIEPTDFTFGNTYSEQAKLVGREIRKHHTFIATNERTVNDFTDRLVTNYLYKGPILEWYMRVKIKLENNYDVFEKLIPKDASVLDLGCGYGFLCYMLSFMSGERTITGVDYDDEKISVANNCYSKNERMNFVAHDIVSYPAQQYDVIILADVLHYLTKQAQDEVLVKCFASLKPGGKIIVRDGDADLQQRHEGTRLTEFFSVHLLKFNKSTNDLHFLSGSHLRSLAKSNGFSVDVLDKTKYTSNVIFVISKNS